LGIAGAALLETALAEEGFMGDMLQAARLDDMLNIGQDIIAVTTMDHAEEIVAPVGEATGAAIAEVYKVELTNAASNGLHLIIGDIPDHHGIVSEAQFMVSDDNAKALDDPHLTQSADTADYLGLRDTEALTNLGIRA